MKTLITLIIFAFIVGCATGGQKVTKSGPFTTIEKYPNQEENIKEAPSFSDCEWVITGTPSALGCEPQKEE